MSKLPAKKRNRLKKSSFALPSKRKYPINDIAHAKAALRFAKRKDTEGAFSTIAAKVYKKYPSLKPSNKKKRRKK
jgi:hypothetical protein